MQHEPLDSVHGYNLDRKYCKPAALVQQLGYPEQQSDAGGSIQADSEKGAIARGSESLTEE